MFHRSISMKSFTVKGFMRYILPAAVGKDFTGKDRMRVISRVNGISDLSENSRGKG